MLPLNDGIAVTMGKIQRSPNVDLHKSNAEHIEPGTSPRDNWDKPSRE
ncbi:MAG TPA: hypothetical protein VMX16_05500 [Terriglobia bacterium]|nr:hypothetical protein [Terriglobia bacterium]